MKTIGLLFAGIMLLSACSKTVKEVKEYSSRTTDTNEAEKNTDKEMEALRIILNSKQPNLALFELLVKMISDKNKQVSKEIILSLSPEEINSIIESIKTDNVKVRSHFLFHGQNYQNNEELISKALMNNESLVKNTYAIEDQLMLSTFSYLKNKSLDNIVKTYTRRIDTLGNELATSIALDLVSNEPSLAREVESNLSSPSKAINALKRSRTILEKIDTYFTTSSLNENEQYTVVMTGVIAGAIYEQVKDKGSFKKIIPRAIEFSKKAKEFAALTKTLKDHYKDLENDVSSFKKGVKGTYSDMNSLISNVQVGETNIHSRRIVNFLHDRVIKGKESKADHPNPSIFSKQISLNENFMMTMDSAKNLSNNLTKIIETTNKVSALFGIKPSKGVQKALETAQKVSSMISTVQSVAIGLSSGGILGGISALSSGPAMSLLGGGSSDSALLSEISQKLDIVIEQQKKIIEMQLETMNMIKELAVMIDEYHQVEMNALAELKDLNIVNIEIAKVLLHENIRGCDNFIRAGINNRNSAYLKPEALDNIYAADAYRNQFYQSFSKVSDLNFLISTNSSDFYRCQDGLRDAFGSTSLRETPLLGSFDTSNAYNAQRFQNRVFKPLVLLLEENIRSNFDNIPLHLPLEKMSDQTVKGVYTDSAKLAGINNNENYLLEQLISVKSLERYVARLLIAAPLISYERDFWSDPFNKIVNDESNIQELRGSNNTQLYANALKMVQSAIAQESIISGEPLLHILYERFIDGAFKKEQLANLPEFQTLYAIRSNRILMTNLLHYSLSVERSKIAGFEESYREAYEMKDLKRLAELVNIGKSLVKVELEGDEFVIKVPFEMSTVSVSLPSPEVLKEDQIMYSQNMHRLLKMQDSLLNALEKVVPFERSQNDDELFKVMLAGGQ